MSDENVNDDCPHDGAKCHHFCHKRDNECFRRKHGMSLSTPHPGYPKGEQPANPKYDKNNVAWCNGYSCPHFRSDDSGWGRCRHPDAKGENVTVTQQCYPKSVEIERELVQLRARRYPL